MEERTKKLLAILIMAICALIVIRFIYRYLMDKVYAKDSVNELHLVADLPDKSKSAELLGEIKKRLKGIIEYSIKMDPKNPDIMLLKKRFNPSNVQETSVNDAGTSYTIDKGSEMHLCLREKANKELHGINLLMFVAIHELAHIMSSSYGHNQEFTKNFKYLLKKASQCGMYTPVDYSRNSTNFCGVDVSHNPLFS